MCGICGVWGAREPAAVEAMVDALRHRGPDDRGTFLAHDVSLGMSRLAVLDTSRAGHQPIQTPSGGIVLVYNGEVYNFRSERRILENGGVPFASGSDTEVVLRMYERYGDDFLLRLRGMFALAVYDRRGGPGRERLLLARDHFGIKPLLYARAGGRLVFASELKALLASGLVATDVDPVALRMLLTYGSVCQPRTMLAGVRMLPPAHRLVVECGAERVERYWRMGADRVAGLRARPYAELVDEVGSALGESLRLQLASDVPLGAFLSGGVDSSLLVAMMTQALGARVETYSVGFEAEGAGIDESGDAARTARALGADHTAVTVRGADVRDRIAHIAWSLDQPTVDGVNTYFVSRAARRGVTVAISGTGGDELFAGYPWFITVAQQALARRRAPWRSMARGMVAALARRRAFDPLIAGRGGERLLAARRWSFVAGFARTYQIFGPVGAARTLAPALRDAAAAGHAPDFDLEPFDELEGGSAVERVTGLVTRGYLTNQLLRDIDAASMAHSLEVRVPFLDPVVADVALSLPESAKLADVAGRAVGAEGTYRDTGAKRVLIDVGRRWLPPDFDVQPKRGFAMPFDAWLRGPLRDVLDDALSERAVRERGLLEPHAAAAARAEFLAGARPWSEPWLLMMLELWCREVLDRAPDRPAVAAPAFATAALRERVAARGE